jgi:hypothetical protein
MQIVAVCVRRFSERACPSLPCVIDCPAEVQVRVKVLETPGNHDLIAKISGP